MQSDLSTQHCVSRSRSTHYHSAIGGKNSPGCLYFFKLITVILGGAKPRRQRSCPCKIASDGNTFGGTFQCGGVNAVIRMAELHKKTVTDVECMIQPLLIKTNLF